MLSRARAQPWLLPVLVCLSLWLVLSAVVRAEASGCLPGNLAIHAAPVADLTQPQPVTGWHEITLPDDWSRRWPEHAGPVWYRVSWTLPCDPASSDAPLALGLGGISMAGEVYLNDTLLWRDASLVEPLSLSWSLPRWWLLPSSALQAGGNTVWVRVVGHPEFAPGLGPVVLGPAAEIEATYTDKFWRQRTSFFVSLVMSAAVGGIFFIVWCLQRTDRAYGWYAFMALCWVLYLGNVLGTSPWPFGSLIAHSRFNSVAFVLYVLSFCLFTWRFGEQHLPRVERALWAVSAVALLVSLVASRPVLNGIWLAFALIFLANCLQFQWHAWRTRRLEHAVMALCWLSFLVVGAHDLIMVRRAWGGENLWGPITTVVATIAMALLLGGRLAAGMRRVAEFNQDLQVSIAQARTELSAALAVRHEQALAHARLQERLRIVHDLHDGLGGNLVRHLALLEHTPRQLSREQMLSLLKSLRDDLRQVIDQGASADVSLPATPRQWAAPLRHRFTRLFDELGIVPHWQFDEAWRGQPTALQCLGLTRLIEEALSNVIKHSRARQVWVRCTQPQADVLQLDIVDDGIGFDLAAVQHAGLNVGMRSMNARAQRLGATLTLHSGAEGTTVQVRLVLGEPGATG